MMSTENQDGFQKSFLGAAYAGKVQQLDTTSAPTAAPRWTEGMTMIKGKYVATIELNFNVDESTDGLLPFETLQAKVTGGELDKAIVAVISDEFGELCSVGLNKQYADLYLVDGGNDND